jgi:hypothetical protein
MADINALADKFDVELKI